MLLIVALTSAIIVTAVWWVKQKEKNSGKYRLDLLALMLWGTFIMILVDHTVGFLNGGGEFLEITTDGLITSGTILGIAMLVPVFLIWIIAVFMQTRKN